MVPEEGDPAQYGIDEDAEPDSRVEAAVKRGKEAAQGFLDNSTRESRSGKSAARRSARKTAKGDKATAADQANAAADEKADEDDSERHRQEQLR